ncbi:MAG: S41 family peptidase [Alphaproteobacteria bacterium]|nr:S41 family peptidase [Alphaproteobacteria bacterium]
MTVFILPSTPSISQSSTNDETYRQLSLFGDAFQLIRDDYVEEVDDKTLISNAINGMLSALDPHSNYLPDDDFKKMQERTRGEFGGLGIEITMEDGYVKVVSPIDDTPAFNAGVQAGDLIVQIAGQDVLGMTLSEAVELMRGPVGSDIDITIRRKDDQFIDITLTRDVIKMRSVRHESYGKVGYIRITTFSEQTTPGLEKAVAELQAEHGNDLQGVILDLRNNPGGLLREAVSVSDAFLEKGEIVSTRGRQGNQNSRYFAKSGDLLDGLPLVILINSGSASASEIVAGALKDHKRAVIMGTRSFGKGSVQSIIPMPGHGAIRITTARYYTPSGVSIQSTGIAPDIDVELAVVENLETGAVREEDLRGHLENNAEGQSNTPAEEDESVNLRDYQLARAIDLIQGVQIFNTINQ